MEEAKIDLLINGAKASQTLGELRDNAEKLNEALEASKIGSSEYNKLNQQLVQTNKQVKNLELGFEALDREQVASELGSVAGAIGDITSATILLGGENETLAKTAENIEKALGVSMAFKGAIEGFSSAFKLFNNVIKTSPIFLWVAVIAAVAAGIGALILKWDEFMESFTNPIAEQQMHAIRMAQQAEIGEEFDKRKEQVKELEDAEREAHEARQEQFDLDIARLEAEGKNSDALKRQKIQDAQEFAQFQLELINKQIEDWRKYYENLFVMSGKSREDFKAQMKGQGIDLDILQAESLGKIEEQNRKIFAIETERIAFERGLREQNVIEVEEEIDDIVSMELAAEEARRKNDEARRKWEEEIDERRVSARKRLYRLLRDEDASDFELRINQLTDNHEAEMELLSEQIPEEAELRVELERQFQENLLEVKREAYEADAEALKEANKQKLDSTMSYVNGSLDSAQDLVNIAESLNSAFHSREVQRIKDKQKNGEKLTASEQKRLDKEAKMQRAFAIAQLAIDTAKGIAGAVSSGASQPYPLNIIAIVTGVAAVLANLAAASKALKAPLPSVGGGGIESAASDQEQQTNAPVINEFETGSSLLNAPQQVVVVEDINNGQQSVQAIESVATFGNLLILISIGISMI